jgi:integrase/recombinase XerC
LKRDRAKGRQGRRHVVSSNLEDYLTAFLDGSPRDDPEGAAIRTDRPWYRPTHTRLPQSDAWPMIEQWRVATGIAAKVGLHSFRATGITAYLKNGGTREKPRRWQSVPQRARRSDAAL